ncbi:MAG: hypothetical protein KDD34_09060, partial [Bdellovibrionales bacterium]|nr:hypothetical protein [Bdellovibrionales bacterium]
MRPLRNFQLLYVFIFLFIAYSSFSQAKVIEKIVAIVDDSIVTLSDIDAFKKKVVSGGLLDDALLKMKDPKEIIKSDKAIVEHLIDERVIDSEIK